MATYTPKQMYVGVPGTSDALLYTAPATGAIVKEIIVTNTTGTAASLTLGLASGAALAAANWIIPAVLYAANSITVIPLSEVLGNVHTIRALQVTSNAITLHISGLEIT